MSKGGRRISWRGKKKPKKKTHPNARSRCASKTPPSNTPVVCGKRRRGGRKRNRKLRTAFTHTTHADGVRYVRLRRKGERCMGSGAASASRRIAQKAKLGKKKRRSRTENIHPSCVLCVCSHQVANPERLDLALARVRARIVRHARVCYVSLRALRRYSRLFSSGVSRSNRSLRGRKKTWAYLAFFGNQLSLYPNDGLGLKRWDGGKRNRAEDSRRLNPSRNGVSRYD